MALHRASLIVALSLGWAFRVADAVPPTPSLPPAVAPAAAPPAAATAAPPAPATVPALDGCNWIPSAPSASPPPRFTVIDLWAPWSSESTSYLPRLSRLSREFASQGVAVVGVTKVQPAFGEERIRDALRKLGGRVVHPIAIAPDGTFSRLLSLTGAPSPPATIVTDATGTVIAACTPAEVEHVLVRIVAGTWTGPGDIAGVRRESSELDDLVTLSESDPALAASRVRRISEVYPHRERDFAARKIVILLRAGLTGDAAEAMRASTDEWIRLQDARELTSLATLWMDPRTNPVQRDLNLAVRAAEASAELSGQIDPNPWLMLMRAKLAAGDPAGARAAAERAMSMGDERMRARIALMLARFPTSAEGSRDGAGQRTKSP